MDDQDQNEKGRCLILYVTINDKKWLLVNVYAPNSDNPGFMDYVVSQIDRFSPDFTIVGGNFNLALDCKIDRWGSYTNNDKAARQWQKNIDARELLDTWRQVHPDRNGFTWRKSKPKLIQSQLDYIFISSNLLQMVKAIETIPGFRTDRSAVYLKLTLCSDIRGPGYWKLNTSLLRDINYVEAMNNLTDIEFSQNQDLTYNKKASWLHAELFFVFVECCVHIETTWCPCGNHVVSTWKPCGVHI